MNAFTPNGETRCDFCSGTGHTRWASAKIYVASSWRNSLQPRVVALVRDMGHEVYDFRNPPGRAGFGWQQIAADWQTWTPAQYRAALQHPLAVEGYAADISALRECDACVLVLPSGRSASWEFGFAMGQGKRGAVLQLEHLEPELMYREAAILTSYEELSDWAWNLSWSKASVSKENAL
jgi:hypothetical protein